MEWKVKVCQRDSNGMIGISDNQISESIDFWEKQNDKKLL